MRKSFKFAAGLALAGALAVAMAAPSQAQQGANVAQSYGEPTNASGDYLPVAPGRTSAGTQRSLGFAYEPADNTTVNANGALVDSNGDYVPVAPNSRR
jgi:hypothetical protein